jgi:hypothetical protein
MPGKPSQVVAYHSLLQEWSSVNAASVVLLGQREAMLSSRLLCITIMFQFRKAGLWLAPLSERVLG